MAAHDPSTTSQLIQLWNSYWWLLFFFGGGIAAFFLEALQAIGNVIAAPFRALSDRREEDRRHELEIARLNAEAARGRGPAEVRRKESALDEPQAVCGCRHHLSFHSHNGTRWHCSETKGGKPCRCQEYVGAQPLGYVFPQTIIDPDRRQLP